MKVINAVNSAFFYSIIIMVIKMDENKKAYTQLAKEYTSKIRPYNDFYERPNMINLIDDVKNKHVLDATCGSGYYLEYFD